MKWQRKCQNKGLNKGQSTLEGVVGLFVFATFFALLLQILWILLAQQIMQSTTLQAARLGSASSMDLLPMRILIFERLKIIPGIQFHDPKIERILPTNETISAVGVYDDQRKRFKLEVDFAHVRIRELPRSQQENYLIAQLLQINITYCFPLRVPLTAAIIVAMSQSELDRLYCETQNRGSYVMLPIKTTATVPLETALWQN